MNTRSLIIEEARKFVESPDRPATKWVHQGRLLGVGIDCIGLVYLAGKWAGLVPTEAIPANYSRRPTGELRRACDRYLVRAKGPALGRIALMRFQGEPHHMGIIGDHPHGFSLIHSYASARMAVEHRLDDDWLNRCVAFYDFPGVE